VNNRYLIPALELSPITLERLLKLVPEQKLDVITENGRFTVREAIAHMADVEEMLLSRLRIAVESPGSSVEFFDEDQRAIDLDYAHSDVWEQMELFKTRRATTIAYVKSIEDWSGWNVHPEQGKMTAGDVIQTGIGHDHYHIEHLTQLLVD